MNHGRALPQTTSLQASGAKTCSSLTLARRLPAIRSPARSIAQLPTCSYPIAATALTGEAKRIQSHRKSGNATLTEASAEILHSLD